MEKIFWVRNGELNEVNNWLQKGGRVKMIKAVSEATSVYSYHHSDDDCAEASGNYAGDIYAYVVVEFY